MGALGSSWCMFPFLCREKVTNLNIIHVCVVAVWRANIYCITHSVYIQIATFQAFHALFSSWMPKTSMLYVNWISKNISCFWWNPLYFCLFLEVFRNYPICINDRKTTFLVPSTVIYSLLKRRSEWVKVRREWEWKEKCGSPYSFR